jgi:hypothetical protein
MPTISPPSLYCSTLIRRTRILHMQQDFSTLIIAETGGLKIESIPKCYFPEFLADSDQAKAFFDQSKVKLSRRTLIERCEIVEVAALKTRGGSGWIR